MISCWPDKMEISGINHVKDVINNASSNLKVIFLPTPAPTSAENGNNFAFLMRTLDNKKMVSK